ncbi:MAG: SPOR domain-containing protein [Gammaproteobacteria bacterium]
MKALVALLLIVNIGFGAWQSSRPATSVHQPAPVDLGVEPLRLLSELDSPAGTVADLPSTGHDPLPSSAPTPTSVIPPATPAANPSPTPAPVAAQCYSLGPFTGLAQATQIRQRLQGLGVSGQPRVEQSHAGAVYRVALPPLPSRDSALQVARQLAADGINDYQVITDERQRNVISLGVFKDRVAAGRRQARVAALGYAPRIEAHDTTVQVFWLDTRETGNDQAAWDALQAEDPQLHRQPRTCP